MRGEGLGEEEVGLMHRSRGRWKSRIDSNGARIEQWKEGSIGRQRPETHGQVYSGQSGVSRAGFDTLGRIVS